MHLSPEFIKRREELLEQGRQEGLQEALKEGSVRLVLRQFARCMGELSRKPDRKSNPSLYRNSKLWQMHFSISRNLQTYRIGCDRINERSWPFYAILHHSVE
jgi:hypothetical protein